ncbi:hypothetical protein M8J75_003314 [Diaphorina citri]|nr:hypothetical protein M8J75_003314 [Diaphorina citri]
MDNPEPFSGRYDIIGEVSYYLTDNIDNVDNSIQGLFSRVFVKYDQYQQELNSETYYKKRQTDFNHSEEESEEEEDYIEDSADQDDNIRQEFDSYWNENGQDIILKLWLEKYRDFVDPNYIDNTSDDNEISAAEVNNRQISNDINDTINDTVNTGESVLTNPSGTIQTNDQDLDERNKKKSISDPKDYPQNSNSILSGDSSSSHNTENTSNIDSETRQKNTGSHPSEAEVSPKTNEGLKDDFSNEWDRLWQDHCLEVYNSQFEIFKQDWIKNLSDVLDTVNNSTGLEYFELIKQEVLSASQKRGKRKNQNPSLENKCENPEDSSDVKHSTKVNKPRRNHKLSLATFIETNLTEVASKYVDKERHDVLHTIDNVLHTIDTSDMNEEANEIDRIGNKTEEAEETELVESEQSREILIKVEDIIIPESEQEIQILDEKNSKENTHEHTITVQSLAPESLEKQFEGQKHSENAGKEKGTPLDKTLTLSNDKRIDVSNFVQSEENKTLGLENNLECERLSDELVEEMERNKRKVDETLCSGETGGKQRKSLSKKLNDNDKHQHIEPSKNEIENDSNKTKSDEKDGNQDSPPKTSYSKFIDKPNYLLRKLGLHFGSAAGQSGQKEPFFKRQDLKLFVSKSKFKTLNHRLKIDTQDNLEGDEGSEDEEEQEEDEEEGEEDELEYEEEGEEEKQDNEEVKEKYKELIPKNAQNKPLNKHTYFKFSDDESDETTQKTNKENNKIQKENIINGVVHFFGSAKEGLVENIGNVAKEDYPFDSVDKPVLAKASDKQPKALQNTKEGSAKDKGNKTDEGIEGKTKNDEIFSEFGDGGEELDSLNDEGPDETKIIKSSHLETSPKEINDTCSQNETPTKNETFKETLNTLPSEFGSQRKKKKRRRKKRSFELNYQEDLGDLENVPEEIWANPYLNKYYQQRYLYWSRYDEGILMDEESWYSVTPEKVAQHIASRCKASDVVIDGFCGCGGNTIQFAAICQKVISIDIDPAKLRLAQHNASVYGVSHKIQFIQGDFFALAPSLQGDVVFLSPPWGGPEYARSSFSIDNIFPEQGGGRRLFQVARGISPNVGYYLPRTSDVFELIPLAGEGNVCEVEQNFVGRKFVAITAYYGNLVRRKDRAS